MKVQYEIRIHGRVQGVGYRTAARNQARSLNLKGFVENLADGSVRAVINGDSARCSAFIRWCRQGSGYSWVEKLDLREMKVQDLEAFAIRY